MDVISLCPLRATSLAWQSRAGALTLTVICKATFDLLPGESRLAAEQEYPNDDENHWDDDPDRSVYSPSDLVPFKPRADVLLVGHAFAPHHEPVRSMVARLAVGAVDKSIQVFGERSWASDGILRDKQPFVRVPLRYERASGGPDTENPVGMRLDGAGPIPNLEPLGATLTRRGEWIAPVGFGPIAWRWPQRIKKLGAHESVGGRRTWHAEPLPDDLDASFFNAAPPDQQTDAIAEGAGLVLENLNAQHPVLVTKLPGHKPRAFVDRAGESLAEIQLTGDTLWIDTDRSLCTVVWRGQLGLRHAREKGRVLVLLEEAGRPLSRAEISRRCRARPLEVSTPSRPSDNETQPVMADRRRVLRRPGEPDPDLPFMKAHQEGARAPSVDTDPTSRIVVPPAVAAIAPVAPPPVAPPPMVAPPVAPPPVVPAVAGPFPAPPALLSTPASNATPPQAREPLASGVLAMSNAAAAPAPRPSSPGVEPEAAAAQKGAAALPEIVDLLWFDAAMLERIRDHATWRELLELLAPKPPEVRYDDEAEPPKEPQEVKDRRDVFGVLTEAEHTGEGELEDVFAGAVSPMGALRPPLVLVVGELQLPFDELETLKATVAAVSPLTAGDKKLKEIVDTVNELLKTPWLEGSSGVAEGLSARVRDAFTQSSGRVLQAGYLEAHTERRLLEQRHYQRRTVLGRRWIRGLLTLQGGTAAIPTYLPDDLATILPMFRRFKARLIVEVHLQQDQYESHPQALRAAALARVAPSGKAKR